MLAIEERRTFVAMALTMSVHFAAKPLDDVPTHSLRVGLQSKVIRRPVVTDGKSVHRAWKYARSAYRRRLSSKGLLIGCHEDRRPRQAMQAYLLETSTTEVITRLSMPIDKAMNVFW
jgi:hypothetical protein